MKCDLQSYMFSLTLGIRGHCACSKSWEELALQLCSALNISQKFACSHFLSLGTFSYTSHIVSHCNWSQDSAWTWCPLLSSLVSCCSVFKVKFTTMGILLLHSDSCWLEFWRGPFFSCLTLRVFFYVSTPRYQMWYPDDTDYILPVCLFGRQSHHQLQGKSGY